MNENKTNQYEGGIIMGVTIESKKFSADMGCGGFNRFRQKVAELSNEEFGKHYKDLESSMIIFDEKKRKEFFKKYDAKTNKLVENNIISVEIANFCYQSDCGGSIDQDQAKQIYEKIKDYDDNICYGYVGRPDCAMFSDLKNIFKDCAENGDTVEWS
jgi:hypothetical protein